MSERNSRKEKLNPPSLVRTESVNFNMHGSKDRKTGQLKKIYT
jgi:hypothetical protein